MTAQTNHIIESQQRSGYGQCVTLSLWIPLVARCGQSVVSFPTFTMGQYFKALNTDKMEVVCPWCIGGGAKLWEWAANPQGAIFTLLLRKSDEGGGGDFYGYHKGCGEGSPIPCPLSPIAGRWAGDRVMLVGDYDSSKLWNQLHQCENISRQLVDEWNAFIEIDDKQLSYMPCAGCKENER